MRQALCLRPILAVLVEHQVASNSIYTCSVWAVYTAAWRNPDLRTSHKLFLSSVDNAVGNSCTVRC